MDPKYIKDVQTGILCEVVMIVPDIEYTDDDTPKPYPITKVYRFDLESSALTELLQILTQRWEMRSRIEAHLEAFMQADKKFAVSTIVEHGEEEDFRTIQQAISYAAERASDVLNTDEAKFGKDVRTHVLIDIAANEDPEDASKLVFAVCWTTYVP
jgi:hypothetical protein